jgi:hypothetical protein
MRRRRTELGDNDALLCGKIQDQNNGNRGNTQIHGPHENDGLRAAKEKRQETDPRKSAPFSSAAFTSCCSFSFSKVCTRQRQGTRHTAMSRPTDEEHNLENSTARQECGKPDSRVPSCKEAERASAQISRLCGQQTPCYQGRASFRQGASMCAG